MHYLRVGNPAEEIPVVRVNDSFYDLRSITSDIDKHFLALGAEEMNRKVTNALENHQLENFEISDNDRIGAPISTPTAVICVGQNYAAHAAESGAKPPEIPIIFLKHPNTVVGPYDDVLIPPDSEAVDWEVELGIVIGARARYLSSPEAAEKHIAGFVVSNDVTERDYQFEQSGGQWSKGKCAESFNPLGPELVTPNELDWASLKLWSQVNGETRQSSSTSDMIFGVSQLVYHLSQYMVLEPGDLINTGTPEGVGLSGKFPYLRDGDVMELGIEGLGTQRQRLYNAIPDGTSSGDFQ